MKKASDDLNKNQKEKAKPKQKSAAQKMKQMRMQMMEGMAGSQNGTNGGRYKNDASNIRQFIGFFFSNKKR
jgi:hypothetical protein